MVSTLLAILVFVLCFSGIAVKILLKKNGKFSGTCASQNPFLKKESDTCGFCGRKVEDIDENENCEEYIEKNKA